MAETNNALRATEHLLTLVISDALMRGVLTAITWLTRPRPGHQMKPFDTFTSAAEWIRTTTRRPYPELERLHAAVERELAKHAASA
jgi:2-keto-4-pentenoate hydratase/2-oxohepta-3-ene-1,7-dioic acid hydratase in catechol pathway